MCSVRVQYQIQEFHNGDWVKVARGSNRVALIYLAHRRAIESGAPPMRVVAQTEEQGREDTEFVYRSWDPADWPIRRANSVLTRHGHVHD